MQTWYEITFFDKKKIIAAKNMYVHTWFQIINLFGSCKTLKVTGIFQMILNFQESVI